MIQLNFLGSLIDLKPFLKAFLKAKFDSHITA